jgi:hypothetical protein
VADAPAKSIAATIPVPRCAANKDSIPPSEQPATATRVESTYESRDVRERGHHIVALRDQRVDEGGAGWGNLLDVFAHIRGPTLSSSMREEQDEAVRHVEHRLIRLAAGQALAAVVQDDRWERARARRSVEKPVQRERAVREGHELRLERIGRVSAARGSASRVLRSVRGGCRRRLGRRCSVTGSRWLHRESDDDESR